MQVVPVSKIFIEMLIVRFVEFYKFCQRNTICQIDRPINLKIMSLIYSNNYWKDKKEYHDVIEAITSGDSGLLAITLGEILDKCGLTVRYHYNGNQYFISTILDNTKNSLPSFFTFDGNALIDKRDSDNITFYFDILSPRGTNNLHLMTNTVSEQYSCYESGDVHWITDRCMANDHLAIELLTVFVKFYFIDYNYPYVLTGGSIEEEVYYPR